MNSTPDKKVKRDISPRKTVARIVRVISNRRKTNMEGNTNHDDFSGDNSFVLHSEGRDDLYDTGDDKTAKKGNLFKRIGSNKGRRKKDNEPIEEEELVITRIDTMHADVDIPLSAKSGEFLDIQHDGQEKQIKVPSGIRGESIRVKMIRPEPPEPQTGLLCCASTMVFDKDEDRDPVVYEDLKVTRVDSEHADIEIPLTANSGEYFSIDHDGTEKRIKVPAGGMQGQSIRVKLTKTAE